MSTFSEVTNYFLSNPEQTTPLMIKVIKKLKRIKKDTIFSDRCLKLKEPMNEIDDVLWKLNCCEAVHKITDNIYIKADERPDDLTHEQLVETVTLYQKIYGHKIQTFGADACKKLNLPFNPPYAVSFYTTNRTMNMRVIDREIIMYHCPIPAVFDHPIQIVSEALAALCYLDEEATFEHIKQICDQMTDDEMDEFNDADKPEWMDKLIWH